MSWTITPQQKVKGLLDEFTGAAAAYSLRNLSVLRNPYIVRVRRSSDNAEQDFTATQVTDGTLTTFCGAGNGFVRTWYDQSGNGVHAVMETTSNQPRIVNGGALETQAGKPQVYFTGGAVRLETGTALTGKSRIDLYSVKYTTDTEYIWLSGDLTTGGAYYGPVPTQNSSNTVLHSSYGTPTLYANDSAFAGTTRGQLYAHFNGYKLEVHENASTSVWTCFDIGCYARQAASLPFAGGLQELVIYASNQSANRSAIQANINAYYAIY